MKLRKTRSLFSHLAEVTARAAGRPPAFLFAVTVVLVWAVTGPLFHYSDTWQLVINTGTTIVTFLMVFLIQTTQNRDNAAIQAKLDGLILTSYTENDFVGIEKQQPTVARRRRRRRPGAASRRRFCPAFAIRPRHRCCSGVR